MAVKIDSVAKSLILSTGLPTGMTSGTMCCWQKFDNLSGYRTGLSFDENNAGSPPGKTLYLQTDNSGTGPLKLYTFDGSATYGSADGPSVSTGVWYWWLGTWTNNTAQTIAAGTVSGGAATWVRNTGYAANINLTNPTRFRIGDSQWGEPATGSIAHVKVWVGYEMSQAEAWQEMWSAHPVRTTNLWGWWPLNGVTVAACLVDRSGNGRTLSNNGTDPDIVDGPPVGWGAAPYVIGVAAGSGGAVTSVLGTAGADALAPAVSDGLFQAGTITSVIDL